MLRALRRYEQVLARGSVERFFLHLEDVVDTSNLPDPDPPRLKPTGPLHIGWVMTPPAPGSGGHTTAFRLVRALEEAGHRCSLYFYDVHEGDVARHARRLRQTWPHVQADVADVANGMPELDVWVATGWETAHVLAKHPSAGGHRFYLVQDYEPYFYPRSSQYYLAEDTYRFGFRGLTAGGWLANELLSKHGMACHSFEFGADTEVYRYSNTGRRDGVVFYAKPEVPRRAYVHGILALEQFARRHPEVPIHIFGGDVGRVSFTAQVHGRIAPAQLADVYNSCRVGLSLSLTNVSLIPWELLACGTLPVVNDAAHNRRVLTNSHVIWSGLHASGLADALAQAYEMASEEPNRRAAAESVQRLNWHAAGRVVTSAIEATVRGSIGHEGASESLPPVPIEASPRTGGARG